MNDAAMAGETPAAWADGSIPTERERGAIAVLRRYHEGMTARASRESEAQRRAMALLRSLLSPEQRRQLDRGRCFTAMAASEHWYRFYPACGHVERITRHGSRWFRRTAYCLHDDRDDPDAMPPADLTVAHLLMVLADEPGFLAIANAQC